MNKGKILILTLLAPIGVFAQRDYFSRPTVVNLEFSLGMTRPGNDSDVYDFFEENTTFDHEDLDGPGALFKGHFQFTNNWSAGGAVSLFKETVDSEDRFYNDEDGFPILQTTELKTAWVGGDLIWTPFGAGETFGTRGWAPRRFVPYLSGGAGFKFWELRSYGDFVDEGDPAGPSIFTAEFADDGVAFSLRFGCGFRVNLTKNLDINFSLEKELAEDDLDGDFRGFGDIDLSSGSAYVGILVRI